MADMTPFVPLAAPPDDRWRFWSLWASRAILVFAVSISAGFVGNELAIHLNGGVVTPDFTVFWTAARAAVTDPAAVYDPVAITALQEPLVGGSRQLRPFAYPPTALMLIGPFGWLPYGAAATVWGLLSCLLFVAAARLMVPARHVAAAFLTPPVVSCLLSLQASLIIAAGIFLGISVLPRRPGSAGAVIGLVALVKPTAVLLFPLAAIAMRSPRALAGFAGTVLAGVLVSMMLSEALWFQWFQGLAGFQELVRDLGLMKRSVTPNGIAFFLGLPAWVALTCQIAGALVGIVTCWLAFRRDEPVIRLVGLAAGSLLCSPYAMYYDLSVLMPALLTINASDWRSRHLPSLTIVGVLAMFTLPLTALLLLPERPTAAR